MTITGERRSTLCRSRLDRRSAVILLVSACLPAIPGGRPIYTASPVDQEPRARASVAGRLIVLYGWGGLGQPGPIAGDGRILVVQGEKVVRVLARGLPVPFTGGLAPSPDGRYVAFAEDAMIQPGSSHQTQGLWLATSDGRTRRRLLLPPPSTTGQPDYSIGPIAWSPNQYALAYAVNNSQDYEVNPRGLGIWLTRYDRPQPRLLATLAQLGLIADGSQLITQLSWSPTGQALAVSAARLVPRSAQPGRITPVVVTFDVATGKTHTLVRGGWYGMVSPAGTTVAYVTGGVGKPGGMALWVADAQGRHGRKLVSVNGTLVSPTWSPDGRTIAYIEGGVTTNGPTMIHIVDVVTGRTQVVLTTTGLSPTLLPAGGRFIRLAWMPARA